MIPTITRPLRDTIPDDQYQPWIHKELLPFLSQARQALNYKAVASVPSFPTDGTSVATTIWSSTDLAVGTAVRLDADVIGWDGSEPCAFTITALFFNDGPAGTQQIGATAAGYTQNTLGLSVDFLIVGNHIELQVNDAGNVEEWTAVITAQVVG